jgi:hypothetical protein
MLIFNWTTIKSTLQELNDLKSVHLLLQVLRVVRLFGDAVDASCVLGVKAVGRPGNADSAVLFRQFLDGETLKLNHRNQF